MIKDDKICRQFFECVEGIRRGSTPGSPQDRPLAVHSAGRRACAPYGFILKSAKRNLRSAPTSSRPSDQGCEFFHPPFLAVNGQLTGFLHAGCSSPYFISSGRIRFSTTATTNTTATQFSAKTLFIRSGKILKMEGFWVKPMPMDRLRAAMVMFRWL